MDRVAEQRCPVIEFFTSRELAHCMIIPGNRLQSTKNTALG
jgi:hypothetical protein